MMTQMNKVNTWNKYHNLTSNLGHGFLPELINSQLSDTFLQPGLQILDNMPALAAVTLLTPALEQPERQKYS